ncbi:MAG: M48 family metallopeptidase [Verrucomicrobiota bacterium]
MDFFEAQHQARQRTGLLIFYFFLAVAGTIISIYLILTVLGVLLLGTGGQPGVPEAGYEESLRETVFSPWLFLYVAGGTALVVALVSAMKTAQFSGGGGAVATELGGRPLSAEPQDPHERKLRNVVEEMAIASGTPVPEIYVMDNEPEINAFAAGFTPNNAAIGVTRGCMVRLNRDELQGVIAHEFSHILNGDMRLNTRLIGLLAGIMGLAVVGRLAWGIGWRSQLIGGGRRNNNGGNVVLFIMLAGLAVMIVGGIGLFFGRLIKAAISRQREFLADASAVQFTRNPRGILGALAKIGGLGSRVQDPHAEEVSHMFFGEGMAVNFNALATHPPLEQRLQAIDPSGQLLAEIHEDVQREQQAEERRQQAEADSRRAAAKRLARSSQQGDFLPSVGAMGVLMGGLDADTNLSEHSLQNGLTVHLAIPEALREAVHHTLSAAAIVYGLIIKTGGEHREAQLNLVGRLAPGIREETEKWQPQLDALSDDLRLPLLDLALPALRQLSHEQYAIFREQLQALASIDHQTTLFEFTLERAVERNLDQAFGLAKTPPTRFQKVDHLTDAVQVILSALAYVGQTGDAVEQAFRSGTSQLASQHRDFALLPAEKCGLQNVSLALDAIAQGTPLVKKNILFAATRVVMTSGLVSEQEGELIRLVADSLDAPLPPLVRRLQAAQAHEKA